MTAPQHRVLVVDDDDDVRSTLVAALRQKSLIIDEADGGTRALELMSEHAYAVIVLDLIMPGTNGFDVLRAMEETTGTAPVVLVVSGAERPVLNQLEVLRIHGIVREPFDPHDLAELVAACAEIRARSAFETMAITTMLSGATLVALLKM